MIDAIDTNVSNSTPPSAIGGDFSRFAKPSVSQDDNTPTISFGDFLDMINPLQHIPLVSAAYRDITGNSISPAARIGGDTLYGAIFGVASAGIAAAGAIADEAFASAHDGKSIGATVVASIFGSDDTPTAATTRLADATSSETASSPTMAIPVKATIITAPVTDMATATITPSLPASTDTAKAMALDRTKMAYGGVMDSTMMQNAQQNQTLALAMAGNNNAIKAQHALQNSRFMTSNPIPGSTSITDFSPQQNISAASSASAAPSALGGAGSLTSAALASSKLPASMLPSSGLSMASAMTANPNNTPAMQPSVETQAAMRKLVNELRSIKGIDQYRTAAQSTPATGSAFNIAN